jgi:hypothetical protein
MGKRARPSVLAQAVLGGTADLFFKLVAREMTCVIAATVFEVVTLPPLRPTIAPGAGAFSGRNGGLWPRTSSRFGTRPPGRAPNSCACLRHAKERGKQPVFMLDPQEVRFAE